MPVYEYKCSGCGRRHEFIQKFSDKPLSTCPVCRGEMRKLISSTSFVLKGTGWYVTDYASNKNTRTETQKNVPDNKTVITKEAKAEAKAEPKTEAA